MCCVLSTANVIILFRVIEIFKENLFAFLENTGDRVKNWECCDESPPYFVTPSLIETEAPLAHSS